MLSEQDDGEAQLFEDEAIIVYNINDRIKCVSRMSGEEWTDRDLEDKLTEVELKDYSLVEAFEFITRIVAPPYENRQPEYKDIKQALKQYVMVATYWSSIHKTNIIVRYSWTHNGLSQKFNDFEIDLIDTSS